MLERAQHRHRRQPAHRAERSIGHDLAQVFQDDEVGGVGVGILGEADAVDDLDAACCADATRRAFTA